MPDRLSWGPWFHRQGHSLLPEECIGSGLAQFWIVMRHFSTWRRARPSESRPMRGSEMAGVACKYLLFASFESYRFRGVFPAQNSGGELATNSAAHGARFKPPVDESIGGA